MRGKQISRALAAVFFAGVLITVIAYTIRYGDPVGRAVCFLLGMIFGVYCGVRLEDRFDVYSKALGGVDFRSRDRK